MFTSRGVAAWRDARGAAGQVCAERIFLGTLDARLIALDARTGRPCPKFGTNGSVDLSRGIKNFRRHEGRQYVVIAAGGEHPDNPRPGDHLLAFALPDDDTGRQSR